MQSENRLKAQYCKQGHEMQSQFNAKKFLFYIYFSLLGVKKGVNLCQIDVFSNLIYECEKDKFTRRSFPFLIASRKRA
jgi:hypothetical protein